jgi:hypothetical protein
MFDWQKARLRGLHLVSAMAMALFLALHLGNHIAGLWGQEAHIAYMTAARRIYRAAWGEPILLVLVAWQTASGITLVLRGWKKRRGRLAWLQAISGLYLAFFLLNHVGAVLFGRGVLNLDTNFNYAAAGLHVGYWSLFFAPYYALALAALGAHLGCAAYWLLAPLHPTARKMALGLGLLLGAALGVAFVMEMAGAFYPVDIPSQYLATYGG